MGTFFVLFGASCVGKSTVLKYLKNCANFNICLATKFSTREIRINDYLDNTYAGIDREVFPYLADFIYNVYGFDYGIDLKEIGTFLLKERNIAMDFGDFDALFRLKKRFGSRLKIIWIDRHITREEYDKIFEKRGTPKNLREIRIQEHAKYKKIYYENEDLFDFSIINSSTEDWLIYQAQNCIEILTNNPVKKLI